jgi:uncharacterized protein YkwD
MQGAPVRDVADRSSAGASGASAAPVVTGPRRRLAVACVAAVALTLVACSSADVTAPASQPSESVDPFSMARPLTGPSTTPTDAFGSAVPTPTATPRPLRERQAAAAAKARAQAARARAAQQRRAAAQREAARERQARAAQARRAAAEKARRATPKPSPAPRTPRATPRASGPAAEVLRLVNVERATAGCKPLVTSTVLARVALAHSRDMAVRGYFAHDSQDGRSPFDRMRAAGYRGTTMGENIAAGQTTAAAVMRAWMNSPGHRANILNCSYRELGVGYHAGGSMRHYWTQNFGAR